MHRVISNQDDISDAVQKKLSTEMATFGFAINKALVTEVSPNAEATGRTGRMFFFLDGGCGLHGHQGKIGGVMYWKDVCLKGKMWGVGYFLMGLVG